MPANKHLEKCKNGYLWQSWSRAWAHTDAEEGRASGGWVAKRGRWMLLKPSAGGKGALAHTASACSDTTTSEKAQSDDTG